MKRINRVKIVSLSVLAGLLSVSAYATAEFFSEQDVEQQWEIFLKDIDTNRDQVITWSEFFQSEGDFSAEYLSVDQQLEEFQKLDTNHDTQIDKQEFIAFLNKPLSVEEMWPSFLEQYDENSDKQVSLDEYRKVDEEVCSKKMIAQMFAEYDLDSDKAITKDEYLSAEHKLLTEGFVIID